MMKCRAVTRALSRSGAPGFLVRIGRTPFDDRGSAAPFAFEFNEFQCAVGGAAAAGAVACPNAEKFSFEPRRYLRG